MKYKECPICKNQPILIKVPLWSGSRGYYGKYDYELKCNGCELLQIETRNIYKTELEMNEVLITEWNKEVKRIVGFMK